MRLAYTRAGRRDNIKLPTWQERGSEHNCGPGPAADRGRESRKQNKQRHTRRSGFTVGVCMGVQCVCVFSCDKTLSCFGDLLVSLFGLGVYVKPTKQICTFFDAN